MVKPLAHFDELYHKEELNDEEMIDFEVMFMLAWCGNYLRQQNNFVKELFKKGSNFTQKDKIKLLKNLSIFVQTILPFYASLQKKGLISISTTPYNHPILPLLIDIKNAKIADSNTSLPNAPISLKEDAIEQVKLSIALYEKTFGIKPTGFWPAEGAVDKASVSIYKEHGLHWIATDEAILFKSLRSDERSKLYEPYIYNGVTIGFRDHGLSDLIGFNYRFKSPEDASKHFMNSLETIAKESVDPTVFVILDGENAWEFFENNAYDFFTALYERLLKTSWCKTVIMDEVSKFKNIKVLDKLSAGSWINGNFNTWSGHPEKNRAWELIYKTKCDVNNYSSDISEDIAKKIKFHFLASECSDWFWRYGDDHVTEFAFEFDALFREHLITIYRLLDLKPPLDLLEPIITFRNRASFLLKPQASITPLIDGKNSSFFEWLGSGSVDESRLYSTMDRVRGPIETIYYGHNEATAFFAFDGEIENLELSELEFHVTVQETGDKFSFEMDKKYSDENIQLVIGERIELALSRSYFKEYSAIHFRFDIVKKKRIIQTMPGFGSLLIDFNERYTQNWFI